MGGKLDDKAPSSSSGPDTECCKSDFQVASWFLLLIIQNDDLKSNYALDSLSWVLLSLSLSD